MKRNRAPSQKGTRPPTPSEEQQEKISVLERELKQLEGRGAPESEILAQRGRIAQEQRTLEVLQEGA